MTFLLVLLIGSVLLFGVTAFFGAPYVPSQRRYIIRAFHNLADLTAEDHVVDLGSGDGIVLRAARRFGAKATGFELNPLLVGISKLLSFRDTAVTIRTADAWSTHFPDDTTVVYIFSVKRDGMKVIRTMQREADRLQRPLRLLCYGNALPELTPTATDAAYFLYTFHPLRPNTA